jgi:O-antigen ligase
VWLLAAVPVLLVPLLPPDLRDRLLRTLVLERGSFEAFTSLIRLFCWQTSFQVFLANPLIGVGYMNFQHVSGQYNPLGVLLQTAENFYLQTAADMGVAGLCAITGVGVAAWRLAGLARRIGAPGSPAFELGAIAPAYLIAIASGNMTGDNLIGFLCSSQFIVFFTLLCQALRDPACRAAGPL